MRAVCLVFCALVAAGYTQLEEQAPQGPLGYQSRENTEFGVPTGPPGPPFSNVGRPSEFGTPGTPQDEPKPLPSSNKDKTALNETSDEIIDKLIKDVFGPNGDDYLRDSSEDEDDGGDEDDKED